MKPPRPRSAALIILLCLWAWFFPLLVADGAEAEQSPIKLIENGGFVVTSSGSISSQHNLHSPLIPASIIKIATALTALELLGATHQYKTEFYLRQNTTLVIKGYGDPFLSSEYISDISRALKRLDIKRIDKIVIDGSSFFTPAAADGSEGTDNPYDVSNGAIAVNFNSIAVQVKKDQSVSSGEPQTPLLELTRIIGGHLGPGLHRVNVSAYDTGTQIDNSLRYTAELFAEFLTRQGVRVSNTIEAGRVDDSCTLIYTFTSPKNLVALVRDCLEYSNNFIANQLFLSSGATLFGYPATWEKGRKAMLQVLEKHFGINCDAVKIREGSGLSRQTRITPFFMLSVLRAFSPYRHLLPANDSMSIKSGTLTGVYSYAGYFNSTTAADPFVIMLNQSENNRKLILKSLHKQYQAGLEKSIAPVEP